MTEIEVFLDAFGSLRRTGTLRRHPGAGRERVTYQHDPDWLASGNAYQFDPNLPMIEGPLPTAPGHEMFGSLGDSAPDTWGRTVMRRAERLAAKTEGRHPRNLQEADYLLGVSDEARVGAFRFRVKGGDEFLSSGRGGVAASNSLNELLESSLRIADAREHEEDLRLILAPGSCLGGARPKASIRDSEGRLSIAKFPKSGDAYSISRWEAIALDMAKDCGIDTPGYDLAQTSHGPVFVTNRFDRSGEQRIPFISAMALTNHKDGDDDGSYLELLDIINQTGADGVGDRIQLFTRIAFSILINNTDDHLRNHGFLRDGARGWKLSPCYDVNPNPHSAGILKTRINFDDATASLDILREVAEFFLKPEDGEALIQRCASITRNWRSYAHRRHAPDAEIEIMERAFESEQLHGASRSRGNNRSSRKSRTHLER